MTPLVTLTGDGTFRAPTPVEAARLGLPDDPYLAALMRLRSLLGDDVEEQIATRLYLPAALGLDETDHLLPATLALLAETTGDLVSYGWRLGTGIGRAWRHARELRERMLDAARIALLGYEGPLMTTALGPGTLAGATFLQSGERTLGDRGAVRDLPMLLAEGLVEHLAASWPSAFPERVPTCCCARTPCRRCTQGGSPRRRAPTQLSGGSGSRDGDAVAQSGRRAGGRRTRAGMITVGVGAISPAARSPATPGSVGWPSLRAACRRCRPTPAARCGRVSPRPATTAPCFEIVVDPRPGGKLGPGAREDAGDLAPAGLQRRRSRWCHRDREHRRLPRCPLRSDRSLDAAGDLHPAG